MDKEGPKDFFISYTHHDQRWAEWIAFQLEDVGYHTIIQAWDFLAGSNFVLAMDEASSKATHTIAVLSPDYFTSSFTPSEWAAAFRRDPTGELGLLLPVRVRPCDVEGLLGQIVYLDLVGLEEAAARTTLLAAAQHQRRKPLVAPLFPANPPALPSARFTSCQAAEVWIQAHGGVWAARCLIKSMNSARVCARSTGTRLIFCAASMRWLWVSSKAGRRVKSGAFRTWVSAPINPSSPWGSWETATIHSSRMAMAW